jgi:hypothetical protein
MPNRLMARVTSQWKQDVDGGAEQHRRLGQRGSLMRFRSGLPDYRSPGCGSVSWR